MPAAEDLLIPVGKIAFRKPSQLFQFEFPHDTAARLVRVLNEKWHREIPIDVDCIEGPPVGYCELVHRPGGVYTANSRYNKAGTFARLTYHWLIPVFSYKGNTITEITGVSLSRSPPRFEPVI